MADEICTGMNNVQTFEPSDTVQAVHGETGHWMAGKVLRLSDQAQTYYVKNPEDVIAGFVSGASRRGG